MVVYLWEESSINFADKGFLYFLEPIFPLSFFFFFFVMVLFVYINVGHSSFIFLQLLC